jgi:UDP:flavonoid glycosyltransferase YjiC (YdhE family)
MKIGIFTYGTRGDVQPYVPLALGLKKNGHHIVLAAPENFEDFIESFGIEFHPLYGNVEEMMNSPGATTVLKAENTVKLMKYFFKALNSIKGPLRSSYVDGIKKVDFIIANLATLPIVSVIAEKQNKKMALTYFMPPVVATKEFPLADFDFLNFPLYNKLTYKIALHFFSKFVKKEINEFRLESGLSPLTESFSVYIDKKKLPGLYCISPSLIPQPQDWESHHKITGFLTISASNGQNAYLEPMSNELNEWLAQGEKPIYMGFGSNGIGNSEKFVSILKEILDATRERILFCTGWAGYQDLPVHENLFVRKYTDHETILPKCKAGIFHGGAGTLAAMLRNNLPVIIISFYTDQPTWGKIAERMKLGVHIPVKKLTASKLIAAIKTVQAEHIKQAVLKMGQKIRSEKGLENAVNEIEKYFGN